MRISSFFSIGVSQKLVEAGKSVPTEYSLGEPGDVVTTNQYYSENRNGDETVLEPSSESPSSGSPEVSGITQAMMTSTPNGAGVGTSTFGAPARRQRSNDTVSRAVNVSLESIESVSRVLNVSSVRPGSPAVAEQTSVYFTDNYYYN